MIKSPDLLKEFEDSYSGKEGHLPFEKALEIFEMLWMEAKEFGIIPLKDPLEDIEKDIRIARILNSCLKSFSTD
jgi:hypothetical protein